MRTALRLPRGITAKTALAFALLAVLLLGEGGINMLALRSLRQATDEMAFSMDIRQRIFEMEGELEKARRLHRDFFIRYPEIGFSEAVNRYFVPSQQIIAKVVRLSEELRTMIAGTSPPHPLQSRVTDITLYLSTAHRFAETFGGLVVLVNRLASPDIGLQGQMASCKHALREYARRQTGSLLIFEQMSSCEQRYWLSRQRSDLQAALNEAYNLERYLTAADSGMTPAQVQLILGRLRLYQRVAQEIVTVDVGIQGKFNDFELQARAVDPISRSLKNSASDLVEEAQQRIDRAAFMTNVIVLLMALTGLAAVAVVGYAIHVRVTRRIVAVTHVAEELRQGNLQLRMESGARDEIDDLALTLNDMAGQLQVLVGNLEEAVATRTAELTQARDELQVAVATLDERNRMLEILSRTDRLTGLANRRRLEEFLHAEILRARRYDAPFCVIMLDIDHFKQVNDNFGHQVGDAVLVAVAEKLSHNARETDLVGRWGGEEFLLVCPQTPLELGLDIAERLRRDLADYPASEAGRVTGSFGVGTFAPTDDQYTLLRRVDAALYRAKSNGRNRVEYGA